MWQGSPPMVYVWATLLLLCNSIAWGTNFFGLPGNWLLLFFAIVYKVVLPVDLHPALSWSGLGLLLVMAIFGEIWEFASGAFGASRQGGSRRGIIYSILGSFIGSVGGALIGTLFMPLIGSLIGALVGGAIGAFGGAYLGEHGREHEERINIGKAAMIARLFGTAGKLACGLVMLIVVTVDAYSDFGLRNAP